MVDESFVPLAQQTSVLYCRLSDFWWRWVLWTMTRRTLKQPGQKNLNSTPSSSSFKDVKSKQGRPITFMAHIGLVCHKSLYYSMVSREFKIFCIEKSREISKKCQEILWILEMRPPCLQNSRWGDHMSFSSHFLFFVLVNKS